MILSINHPQAQGEKKEHFSMLLIKNVHLAAWQHLAAFLFSSDHKFFINHVRIYKTYECCAQQMLLLLLPLAPCGEI